MQIYKKKKYIYFGNIKYILNIFIKKYLKNKFKKHIMYF